jgi:phage gp36-like protein
MYCSSTDISPLIDQAKMIRLLGLDDEGGVSLEVPEETIEKYIVAASSDIDSVLAPMYVVPITAPQSLLALKGICARLAVEAMYEFQEDGKIPEHITTKADKSRDQLAAYLAPKTALPDAQQHGVVLFKSNPSRNVGRVFGVKDRRE